MVIGAGIDIPYSGFELPLALLTFPLAFVFVLMFGYKYVKKMDYAAVQAKLNNEPRKKFGFRVISTGAIIEPADSTDAVEDPVIMPGNMTMIIIRHSISAGSLWNFSMITQETASSAPDS